MDIWWISDWFLGALPTEQSHDDIDHICNSLGNLGLNLHMGLWLTSIWTETTWGFHHATLHFDHVLQCQQGLDEAKCDAQFQCWYCFVFQKKNVKMFMRLLTQASIIYTTEMQVVNFDVAEESTFHSRHGICSCVYWEYPISLNAIQKNLLSNKSPYFTIYTEFIFLLTLLVFVWYLFVFKV